MPRKTNDVGDEALANGRPYRSHLLPACIPCRKRRSRCKTEPGSSRCLLCTFHGNDCRFPPQSIKTRGVTSAGQKRQTRSQRRSATSPAEPPGPAQRDVILTTTRCNQSIEDKIAEELPFPNSTAPITGAEDAAHIVGPVLSPDAQPIAGLFAVDAVQSENSAELRDTVTEKRKSGRQSVLFNTVRKRPPGTTVAQTCASVKNQIIEKLVEPHCADLVDLYFDKIHKCLPLLDPVTFRQQYQNEKEQISPALLACLFAQTMIYRKQSLRESGKSCPDVRFVWNLANEALFADLHLSPGMPTIVAVLLNLLGRPVASMIGNGIILGSAVSMAHSFGLNRNCLGWDISAEEKHLRTRTWWAIVILDKWSSVAYGTPPHLVRSQCDVPTPTFTGFSKSGQHSLDPQITPVFCGLLTLTEVLDQCLTLIFCLQKDPHAENSLSASESNIRLSQWEGSLPTGLRKAIVRGTGPVLPGASNLRLAYLYVKFLIRKMNLDDDGPRYLDHATRLSIHGQVRRAAEDIVLFIQELDDLALYDFWLPSSGFVISSTAAFLLRCAIDADSDQDGSASKVSLKLARDLIAALQFHRQRAGWDVGNICLAQYSAVLERFASPGVESLEALPDFEQLLAMDFPDSETSPLNLWDWFEGI